MATSPYASALNVDPQREQEVLLKLKQNPQKMAELGLAANENFANLKSDPVKYNRVLSYVKNEAYKSPAYSAIASGQTKPEFATAQAGSAYSQTPTEYQAARDPELRSKFNVDALESRSNQLTAGSYSALPRIREEVKKKGGYNIEEQKDQFEQQRVGYADAYRRFANGQLSSGEYASLVSQLSSSARNLEKTQTGFREEVERAAGNYRTMQETAKTEFDNAYKRYTEASATNAKGYGESRAEKLKAAEAVYESAQKLLDEAKAEQKGELREVGGNLYQVSYDPATGKYKTTLVRAKGGGGGGGGELPVPSFPSVPSETPAPANDSGLEAYIKQKELERGMTLAPAAREKLKEEYQRLNPSPQPKSTAGPTEEQMRALDPTVRMVIRGQKSIDSIGEVEYRKVKGQLDAAISAGWIRPEETLSEAKQKIVSTISDDVRSDKDVSSFIEVRDGYERVRTGADLNNSTGDLSLIFGYMKMLDPNSVVRETEFNNAEEAIGWAQRSLNLPKKYLQGDRLTENGRKYFTEAANRLYERKKESYKRAVTQYNERAKRSGIDPELVLRDYGTTFESGGAADILSKHGVAQ